MQALAAAIVAFTFLYFRRQYTISPEAVYRQAMIRLNTSPGVLEVRPFWRASAVQGCLLECRWADRLCSSLKYQPSIACSAHCTQTEACYKSLCVS